MAEPSTKNQIRGSGLLLSGRFISLALNLLTQILMVRYLSKTDYGLFSYALEVVSIATTANLLAMERTVSRFIPIYEENKDPASAAGVLLLACCVVILLGIALVALVMGFGSFVTGSLIKNPEVMSILVILIALAPVNAVDHVFQSLFSVFGKAKIIYLRRHILGPCLKLAAISLTIALSASVHTLSIAYMLAGVLCLLLYGTLLPGVLREHHLLEYFRPGVPNIEYRRLLGFSIPGFTADIANALRLFIVVALLESMQNLASVAEYQAVMPLAKLNAEVLVTFSLLFLPIASRLFAQQNSELLTEVRSHVSLWVTVLSFPIFAVCIILSEPLIVLLLGARYSSSAPVLAILAIGFFFYAAMGLNQQTLRALGRVKALLYADVLAVVVTVAFSLLLIPGLGAIGAAIATSVGMIFYSGLNTLLLWHFTGTNPLPWQYVKVYLVAAATVAVLAAMKWALGFDSIWVSLASAAMAWAVVVASCWKLLRVAEIFPEAEKLPGLLKRILGRKGS